MRNNCNCEHETRKDVCRTPDWMMDCGCPTKLSSLCVVYQGYEDLDCLGVRRGDRLENIIININDRICRIITKIEEGTLISSVGDGAEVYKGETEEGINEIRTIEGATPIKVQETGDTITVSLDTSKLCEVECIKNIKKDVVNISKDIINYIKSHGTKSFASKGSKIIDLPVTPSSVLSVSYCGAVLPPNGYTVNGDIVTLQLSQFGLTMGSDDTVIVLYNV